jgi:hypothetical protein
MENSTKAILIIGGIAVAGLATYLVINAGKKTTPNAKLDMSANASSIEELLTCYPENEKTQARLALANLTNTQFMDLYNSGNFISYSSQYGIKPPSVIMCS